jgi:hypothetical protein
VSTFTVLTSLTGAVVFAGAGLAVAVTAQRRFFPHWRGSVAATVVVLVWLCWALALGQVLGAFGLLRRIALLTAAVLSAAAAIGADRWTRAQGGGTEPAGPAEPAEAEPAEEADAEVSAEGWHQYALTVGTVVLVALVAAVWTARTVIALRRGINDPDSLGYHVPFIVTFAHSGYADQHRLLLPFLPVQFFPANDELLSAIVVALTHSLAFAALKNLLFAALSLVAAHAVGKAFGAARLTVAATAIVLGVPVFAFSQPGEAVNDTLALLLLVGGLAVVAHARDRPGPYLLALACGGLMLGIKFSAIVPAAALAALALILLLARVPRHRWRWAGAGLLASAALGGSWYVRNAVDYGNPVPPVQVAIGPLHLHTVHGADAAIAYSVAHYAFHGRLLDVFSRGLGRGLGPFYLVLVALLLFGAMAAFFSKDRFPRGLAGVAIVGVVGYIFTPATAYGPPNAVPQSFVINLHYAVLPLLAGAMAGALALARWRWAGALPVVGIVAVATGISRGRSIAIWSPEMGGAGFDLLLVATAAAGVAALAWYYPSAGHPSVRNSQRRMAKVTAVLACAVVLVAVAVVAGRYPRRQVTDPVAYWAATAGSAHIAEWTADVADLYGPNERNHVDIMSRLVDGAAEPIVTCKAWKQALRDTHAEYAAVLAHTVWSRWLRADPAFLAVADELDGATPEELRNFRRYDTVVFQIVGVPDMNCPGQG